MFGRTSRLEVSHWCVSLAARLPAGVLRDSPYQLVEPIAQPIEASDSLIPSLCALLLGTCYEFNREPGEITR